MATRQYCATVADLLGHNPNTHTTHTLTHTHTRLCATLHTHCRLNIHLPGRRAGHRILPAAPFTSVSRVLACIRMNNRTSTPYLKLAAEPSMIAFYQHQHPCVTSHRFQTRTHEQSRQHPRASEEVGRLRSHEHRANLT